jgi:hypothetical protein
MSCRVRQPFHSIQLINPIIMKKGKNTKAESGKRPMTSGKTKTKAKTGNHEIHEKRERNDSERTVQPADDRQQAERYNVTGRRELLDILEEYGVSTYGFDGLRADAYEKDVAGRSLGERKVQRPRSKGQRNPSWSKRVLQAKNKKNWRLERT